MSITFSSGGFDGTMRSDADGNLFVETTGNSKTINIGGLKEFTGSIERTLDRASWKIIQETEKELATGKTFQRSGSAINNHIEFVQKGDDALIIVSGGNPGFTAYMNDVGDRGIRARGDVFASGSVGSGMQICSTGVAMDGSPLDYYIQMNHIGALGTTQTFGDSNGTGFLMVSQSGDTRVSKNLIVDGGITATSLNVTSITSSIVTSSILQTEGSNIFGDEDTDSHKFNGHITASGNISGSSTSNITVGGVGTFGSLDISGNIDVDGTSNLDNIDVDGTATFALRTVFEPVTFTAGDTSPDVRFGRVFKTNNGSVLGTTTIDGFDNGVAGQIIHIIHMDNSTDYSDETNLQLFRGLDHTTAETNDTITFVCVDGTKWVELGRSDNT